MQFSKELLKGAVDVLVLRLLAERGEAYGYQLIELIKKDSGDVFELQEGTLYPLLYRLEDRGLITSERKEAKNGKIRRYYHLTKKGRGLLTDKTKEYKGFIKGLSLVLDLSRI
ncbi:MAG: helix-turn-helix transcriptional regulator [Candidatus Uhrbacteria bacterium]